MQENNKDTKPSVQRLCSEIQLFDLCDREQCDYKKGRFCTDTDLLARFEAIAEEDQRSLKPYMAEELDNEEEGTGDAYEGEFDGEEYEDGDDEWNDD